MYVYEEFICKTDNFWKVFINFQKSCSCCPSLSPSLLIGPWDVEYVSVVLFCYILDTMLCYVWKKNKKIVDNKKKIQKSCFFIVHSN